MAVLERSYDAIGFLGVLKYTGEINSTDLKEAVELINHRAIVEASGNVHLETVRKIAECGVDVISSSAIVAKAPTLDIALDM